MSKAAQKGDIYGHCHSLALDPAVQGAVTAVLDQRVYAAQIQVNQLMMATLLKRARPASQGGETGQGGSSAGAVCHCTGTLHTHVMDKMAAPRIMADTAPSQSLMLILSTRSSPLLTMRVPQKKHQPTHDVDHL